MAVPTQISDLSTTIGSNSPAGSDAPTQGDDNIRAAFGLIRQYVGLAGDVATASTITPTVSYGAAGLTGTTTVTAISSTGSWAGRRFAWWHKGTHQFTHSGTLVCPGGASKTFVSGDVSIWMDRDGAGTWAYIGGYQATTQAAAFTATTGAFSSDLSVNTNKFTVAASSGNTVVAGTLGVTSDLAVNTNKFTVAAASGNTVVAGTLGVTSDVAVNTNKFTVAASTGNTVVAGTLGVTGDFAINTNKFTVTASSGAVSAASTVTAIGFVATATLKNANYTFALADAGTIYYNTDQVVSYTWTIPPNSSVAFPIGTTIRVVHANGNAGSSSVAIARGAGVTLYMTGSTTSADRTLNTNTQAILIKVGTDTWVIDGVGVT
jgi:hypothetical protein